MEFFGDTVEQAVKAALKGRTKRKLPSLGRRIPGRRESSENCREWLTSVVLPAHCKVVALSHQIGVVIKIIRNIDVRTDRLEALVNRSWIELLGEQSPPSVPRGGGRRRSIRLAVLGDMAERILLAYPRFRQIVLLKYEIRNLKRAIDNLEAYLPQIQRLKDQANNDLQPLLRSNRYRSCFSHKGAAFPGRATCFAVARRYGHVPSFPSGVPNSVIPRDGPL